MEPKITGEKATIACPEQEKGKIICTKPKY
jgi:hypothetical protein